MNRTLLVLLAGVLLGLGLSFLLPARRDAGTPLPASPEQVAVIPERAERAPLTVARSQASSFGALEKPATDTQTTQPVARKATAPGMVVAHELEPRFRNRIFSLRSALEKSQVKVDITDAELPWSTWEDLRAVSDSMLESLHQAEKARGPLMREERLRCDAEGKFEDFPRPETIQDPAEQKRAEAELRKAQEPRTPYEQTIIGGSGGKVRIYHVEPLPGSKLYEVVTDQLRILKEAANRAVDIISPRMQVQRPR